MNSPTMLFNRKSLLLSLILIMFTIIISGGMGIYVLSDPGIKDSFLLTRVALIVSDLYPEGVDQNQIIKSARDAIMSDLDRYSAYTSQTYFEQMDEELSGAYQGIGVSIIKKEKGLLIMSVRENSPAYKVGLLSGDIIVKADSIELKDLTSSEASALLRGPEKSELSLQVYRTVNEDTFTVKIIREKIPLMHIPYAGLTNDSLIYIRLLDFGSGSSTDVNEALDSLLFNKKEINPKGVILDLRGNPGGLFSEAYKVVDLFLEKGLPIVGTTGRSRWKTSRYYANSDDFTNGLPLAIIVDKGSASSSEIVAGALKYHERAILVGDTTFGKGLVQGFVRYPEGDGLRLTISRYFFGENIYLNEFDSTLNEIGDGIEPDYYFQNYMNQLFLRKLENSLHLFNFANKNQDGIIEAALQDNFDDIWLEKLTGYLKENDFEYLSERTEIAETMEEFLKDKDYTKKLEQSINKFISRSSQIDNNEVFLNTEYIKNRLKQIAFERKFGLNKSYEKVIVNELPVIKFASKILLEEN